jgi:beta-1,4-mannosyl-glycoprotein beta-1,4-N-acetylglucosaminyltransferase
MKIIDAITFNDELDMLEARIQYLYNVVDFFLIVESNYTHSGNPKPLVLKENLSRFSKYSSKMMVRTYGVDSTFDFVDSWKLEVAQRNGIMLYLDEFDAKDIIMVSDADEIPNKEKIEEIKTLVSREGAVRFNQLMFYYDLTNRLTSYPIWGASYAATKEFLKANSPNSVRMEHRNILGISDAGWHLTYFMSASEIKKKIESFAHTEFNTPFYTNLERIQKCIDDKIDIYEREDHSFETVDPSLHFTQEFLKYFSKWA